MKARDMRDLTRAELVQHQTELEEERFNLKMRRSLKALDNPLRLRLIDRQIARVRTVMHEDSRGIRLLAQSKSSVLSTAKAKMDQPKK